MLANKQKASFLLYVVFIVSLLLVIAFGLSGLLLAQIKMLGEIGYSVVALYAADAGIEQVMMQRDIPPLENPLLGQLSEDIKYEVSATEGGEGQCPSERGGMEISYCLKSIGTYKGVKRAIEVEY